MRWTTDCQSVQCIAKAFVCAHITGHQRSAAQQHVVLTVDERSLIYYAATPYRTALRESSLLATNAWTRVCNSSNVSGGRTERSRRDVAGKSRFEGLPNYRRPPHTTLQKSVLQIRIPGRWKCRIWKYDKKLVKRWDSERELSLRRHCTRTRKYNRLLHKFRHKSFSATLVYTRNSSGDEIANVNFLYDDIVHAVKIQ